MYTSTPATVDALYSVGFHLLDAQRSEDAKHVFRTMLLLAPADERGWLGLGKCHENAGELAKSAQLYSLGRQACPGSARCVVALARALHKLDLTSEANDVYDEARALAACSDDEEIAGMLRQEGVQ